MREVQLHKVGSIKKGVQCNDAQGEICEGDLRWQVIVDRLSNMCESWGESERYSGVFFDVKRHTILCPNVWQLVIYEQSALYSHR